MDGSGQALKMTGVEGDHRHNVRLNDEQSSVLFDHIPQGVVFQDIEGRSISMNMTAERILGNFSKSFLSGDLNELEHRCVHEDGSSFSGDELPATQALRSGKEIRDIIMGISERPFVEMRWINITAVPMFVRDMDMPYQVCTLIDDITDRKRTETILGESEERLRLAQEIAKIGIIERDLETGKETWAPGVEMVFGLSPGGVPASHMDWVGMIHPEDRERAVHEIEMAVRGEVFEDDWRTIWQDGSVHWVQGTGRVFNDRGGRPIKMMCVTMDITERKMIEEDLKRSNADLREFASVASHDLRYPLSRISSFLEILRRRYEGRVLDERARELIDHAIHGSQHMRLLIDDLLEYSKIDQACKRLEPVDMEEVLEQVEQNLSVPIDRSGAIITKGPLPTIKADRTQMMLLLQNLLSNAIKFQRDDPPRIDVHAELIGSSWQFSIKDNGIGIDPQFKDRLFKMFSRLHSSARYEGNGIGLASVKKILERHGGRIWVESEVGKGATFFFMIPVHDAL